MPTYDYRCPRGHEFELFHGMSDPPPEVCEVCGEGPVERVLSPVAVHFKGSGFYATDYGRGAKKRDKDGEGSSGDGKKSDEKPAAAAPAETSSSSEKKSSA